MWYYLCFILLFQISNCEEITSVKNETIVEETFNTTNVANHRNNSIEMQRIIQPSAQTQQIERALTTGNSSLVKSKSDFRPSPHLETYFEFNKVPVVPAMPEAKQFTQHNFGDYQNAWTTQLPWTTQVKFPTASVPTTKETPYPFYNGGSTGKSYNLPQTTDVYYKKPLGKIPTVDQWNEFIANYEKPKTTTIKNQFDFIATVPPEKSFYGNGQNKAIFDFTAPPKPMYGSPQQTKFDFTAPVPVDKPIYDDVQKSNFDIVEKSPHEVHGSSWKKIIKFLTAFIPIGLLISALTPTVITVTSVNGTQSRYRAENSGNHPTDKLISSLNQFSRMGCEDRILCELLLSATATNNAEEHVQNLLNTFTDGGKAVEKAEEMKRIFRAVKNQDCKPIICENMKEKT